MLLGVRQRAENLYRSLVQLESQLDQVDRVQAVLGHSDEDHLDDSPEAPTYKDRRAELQAQIETAMGLDRDLIPYLEGIKRREELKQRHHEELSELQTIAEIKRLRVEVLPEEERLSREREDEMDALRYEQEAAVSASDNGAVPAEASAS